MEFINEKNIKIGKRHFILALILLLITNVLMGLTLTAISKKALREQIEERMLDVVKSAAYMLNGDELKALEASDVGNEAYMRNYNILSAFQSNMELEYIYAVRQVSPEKFVLIIDPDPEDPGVFGESIATTPEIKKAGAGEAKVEKKAHSDEWGRFYSAYCPVFDSEGNVAAIVGVDFDAEWYDNKLKTNWAITIILTMVALAVGIVLSFIIMSENRKRITLLFKNMDELEKKTASLDNLIMKSSIKKLDFLPKSENSVLKTLATSVSDKKESITEYDEINGSIATVYSKLDRYFNYIKKEVYVDDTTGVQNKAAYKNKVKELDEKIADSNYVYSVGFFDINNIKRIYTHYGFEAGERLMFECAKLLQEIWGEKNVYHITGDEFIVIMEGESILQMKDDFAKFEELLIKHNKENAMDNLLSVAKGYSSFIRDRHKDYRMVFIDAKANCDLDKEKYYRNNPSLKTDR